MSKVNILIVDDLTENLMALETILGDLDQNLFKARSGPDALRQLLARDFALVLLDILMVGPMQRSGAKISLTFC
jgi:CheY-like chemotaxis protein